MATADGTFQRGLPPSRVDGAMRMLAGLKILRLAYVAETDAPRTILTITFDDGCVWCVCRDGRSGGIAVGEDGALPEYSKEYVEIAGLGAALGRPLRSLIAFKDPSAPRFWGTDEAGLLFGFDDGMSLIVARGLPGNVTARIADVSFTETVSQYPIFDSVPPSRAIDILESVIGLRIVDLFRYSWWPGAQAKRECGIDNAQVFSLTAGPFVVVFETGAALRVYSDPKWNSVTVQSAVLSVLDEDPELFAIASDDETYATPFWRQVAGRKLLAFSVLKPKVAEGNEATRFSEKGLLFHVEGSCDFVASHNLFVAPDDFSVAEVSQLDSVATEEALRVTR